MREAPDHVTDAEVLDAVRRAWSPEVDAVAHLPVGFGAHHWVATEKGVRHLFVTLDTTGDRHTADSLEAAYATAAALDAEHGLEFVLATLPTPDGRRTAPFGAGALSATPWCEGTTGDGPYEDDAVADEVATLLRRLHAVRPPPDAPRWRPLVAPDLGDDLTRRLAQPWTSGPHGERARAALTERLRDVVGWAARYHALSADTDPDGWVVTHGEPHTRNLLRTAAGTRLVDWESLKVAPRERDFATLLERGTRWTTTYGGEPDRSMVELFDLEWRLDEIAQYAIRFERPHAGTSSDAVAIRGLEHELTRPDRLLLGGPRQDDGLAVVDQA